jgi:hypothetical protein
MISHFCPEPGTNISNLKHIHQEVGKFINLRATSVVLIQVNSALQEAGEVILNISGTGSRWADYWPGAAEIINKFIGQIPRNVPVAGIKGSLTATGLFRIVENTASYIFQHTMNIPASIRIQLVNKAGYKQIYFHSGIKVSKFAAI